MSTGHLYLRQLATLSKENHVTVKLSAGPVMGRYGSRPSCK